MKYLKTTIDIYICIYLLYIYICHFESTAVLVAAATPQTLIRLSVYFLLTFRYIDFDTSIEKYFILLHNPFTIHASIHTKKLMATMSMATPPHLFSNFSGVNSVRAPNFDSAKHRLNGKTCCACRRIPGQVVDVQGLDGWKMIWMLVVEVKL